MMKIDNMLYTSNFIFIAYPKSGSSFVRKTIKSCHIRLRRRSDFLPHFFWPEDYWFEKQFKRDHPPGFDQHGTRRQIAEKTNDKSSPCPNRAQKNIRQIVTTIRNPIAQFESDYNYEWWRRWEKEYARQVKKRYSAFPAWDAPTFYNYLGSYEKTKEHEMGISLSGIQGVGPLSSRFIRFFLSTELLESLKNRLVSYDELFELFMEDTNEIHFLSQEALSQELSDLFKSAGRFNVSELIGQIGDVRVNKTKKEMPFRIDQSGLSDSFADNLRSQDRFMFDFFNSKMERKGIELKEQI